MRKYNTNGDLEAIVCNRCGRHLKIAHGVAEEGVFQAEYQWGFFSEKDGEIHCFDLCEKCYDEMIGGFVIDTEIKEAVEFV